MTTAQLVVASADSVADLYTAPTPAGDTYTARATPTGHWGRPATDGAGTYVAVDADTYTGIVSTDDGATWSIISVPLGVALFFHGGLFHSFRYLTANTMAHLTSSDGSTWSSTTVVTNGVGGWVPTSAPVFFDDTWVAMGTQLIGMYVGSSAMFVNDDLDTPWTSTLNAPVFSGWGVQGPSGGRQLLHPLATNGRILLAFSQDLGQPSWLDADSSGWTAGLNSGTGRVLAAAWTGTTWYGVGSFTDGFVEKFSWAESSDGKTWTHHNESTLGRWQGFDIMWDGTHIWAAAVSTDTTPPTDGAVFRLDPAGPTWTRIDHPASTSGIAGVTGYPQPILFDRLTGTAPLTVAGGGSVLRDSGSHTTGTAPFTIDGTGVLAMTGPVPAAGAAHLAIGGTSILSIAERPAVTAPEFVFPAVTSGHADTPGGIETYGPPAVFDAAVDGTLTWPTSTTGWRAVLVDKHGNTIHQIPNISLNLDPIVETLNQATTTTITVSAYSPAGSYIDETVVKPELEVQIYRGDRLWFFGPIVDPRPDTSNDTFRISLQDPSWFLSRVHVGELGGALGGHHPPTRDFLSNPRFDDGLGDWQILRTVSFGAFPGFGVPEPGQVTVVNTPAFPGYRQAVKFDTPLSLDDSIQIFQDLEIHAPPQRPLNVRFSAYWFIPADAHYAPTNQRFALLMTKLPIDANLPVGYYTESFYEADSKTVLGDTVERGKPLYHECSIQFPAGAHEILHVAICAPQGVSYAYGCELRGDDGIDYIQWDPSSIAGNLVTHAQDSEYGKGDYNIGHFNGPSGAVVDRTYVFEEHTNIGSAIDQLSRDGWFDWAMVVTPTDRTHVTYTPRRGSFRPECAVRMDSTGVGNVASITTEGSWTSASTSVAGTTQTKGGRHEAAATSGAAVNLEQVFAADRETQPSDLQGRTDEHLVTTADPTVVEFTCRPGDVRFLLGLQVGDTVSVHSELSMAAASGVFRVVEKSTDPAADTATFKVTADG